MNGAFNFVEQYKRDTNTEPFIPNEIIQVITAFLGWIVLDHSSLKLLSFHGKHYRTQYDDPVSIMHELTKNSLLIGTINVPYNAKYIKLYLYLNGTYNKEYTKNKYSLKLALNFDNLQTNDIIDLDELFGAGPKELNIGYEMRIIGNNKEYDYNETLSTFIENGDIKYDDNIWIGHELYDKIESVLVLDLTITRFAMTFANKNNL